MPLSILPLLPLFLYASMVSLRLVSCKRRIHALLPDCPLLANIPTFGRETPSGRLLLLVMADGADPLTSSLLGPRATHYVLLARVESLIEVSDSFPTSPGGSNNALKWAALFAARYL
ncbi:hypothetical protein DL96DRAFT_202744 [Flagelloscypha sp. PMI_526]|nr:hypothetical protein DL96DRAFT_202744 [Flagelloscypha sp. PMI_526]